MEKKRKVRFNDLVAVGLEGRRFENLYIQECPPMDPSAALRVSSVFGVPCSGSSFVNCSFEYDLEEADYVASVRHLSMPWKITREIPLES